MSDQQRRESSLFGEMRRMVRTSGAVGGIAARVAASASSACAPIRPRMPRT